MKTLSISVPVIMLLNVGPKADGTIPEPAKEKELDWHFTDEALVIRTPSVRPCEHAYVFKFKRNKLY